MEGMEKAGQEQDNTKKQLKAGSVSTNCISPAGVFHVLAV